ncbi:hypothetical protein TNCV_1366031 [Trichonephila clavipes]|nr:hypothetical protein TNCV_1366031 [Trichonephila clavipes]
MSFKNCWIPVQLNKQLTVDELIEMHEIEQGIEELESVDLVQSKDRMMVGNWTEGLSLIEKEEDTPFLTSASRPTCMRDRMNGRQSKTGVSLLKINCEGKPLGDFDYLWMSEKKRSGDIKQFKSRLKICFIPGLQQ